MIYSLFGVLALIGVYFLKGEDELTRAIRYILLFLALVFIWGDIYTYAILPTQIEKFWNGGAGLTYGNSTNNITIFNNGDDRVLYFVSHIKSDYIYIEWARTTAFIVGLLLLTVYVIRFLNNTLMGGGSK